MSARNDGGAVHPSARVWLNESDLNATAPNGEIVPPGGSTTLHEPGMSLRAYFAGLAMQSALTHPMPSPTGLDDYLRKSAAAAVKAADALLEELAK